MNSLIIYFESELYNRLQPIINRVPHFMYLFTLNDQKMTLSLVPFCGKNVTKYTWTILWISDRDVAAKWRSRSKFWLYVQIANYWKFGSWENFVFIQVSVRMSLTFELSIYINTNIIKICRWQFHVCICIHSRYRFQSQNSGQE